MEKYLPIRNIFIFIASTILGSEYRGSINISIEISKFNGEKEVLNILFNSIASAKKIEDKISATQHIR